MKRLVLLAVLLAALFGCIQASDSNGGIEMGSLGEKVFFPASDNVKISANYWKSNSKNAVILVHQFNSSKEAYNSLAKLLNDNGFGVLALDLRGHGESKSSGNLSSPQRLSPKDFQNMALDVQAAEVFLESKGFLQFGMVGASIGANLAIIVPSSDSKFKAAVALSPGEDYRSLAPLGFAKEDSVPTLLVASSEDEYSFETSQKLGRLLAGLHEFLQLENSGHGTNMLSAEPELNQKILEWFQKYLK